MRFEALAPTGDDMGGLLVFDRVELFEKISGG